MSYKSQSDLYLEDNISKYPAIDVYKRQMEELGL